MKKFVWEHADELGRVCTCCKEYKLYSNYHRHNGCKFGYNTVCKECRILSSKTQYSKQSNSYKLWHTAKSRAKIRGREFNIEISDVIIPKLCPILGTKLDRPSIDRIDNSKGYVKGNIRVISYDANRIKGCLTKEQIINLYNYVCEI